MSGVTYEKPDEETKRLLDKVITKHHKRLREADVQVLLLVAYGPVNEDGETVGPAIVHHGAPAIGLAKIVEAAELKSEPILDSAGRPKMRLRKHDREFGWFDEVAKRWGPDSQEAQQAQRFIDDTGQLYFGGEWKAVQP